MKTRNYNFLFLGLLLVTMCLSLCYGSVKVPLKDIAYILSNKLFGSEFELSKASYLPIVYYVRLPRIVVGALVGGALALCGCSMQSLLKNPVVDASIVGISSGAGLGAVCSIALGLSQSFLLATPILAIFFALFIAAVIYWLSSSNGENHSMLLVLAGLAISSFVGAISSLILTNFVDSQLREYLFWSMGSLAARRWEHVIMALPILVLSWILFHYGKELNILLLGDEEARSLGIDSLKLRRLLLILLAILSAVAVCVSGNIAFVGLIVPHILRRLFGSSNEILLKYSFLAGAFFLTLSDLLARSLFAPKEISVGIITALLGAPYFLSLLLQFRKGGKAWN